MKRKWWEIKAQGDDETEVWIYAEIGEDYWGDGSAVGARKFAEELAKVKTPRIVVRLNSPGGDVFEGQAIYSVLKNHPASVTTSIDGLAASVASVIALAGDHVVMGENALYMIHEPYGWVAGGADDLRKYAELLEKTGETMAGVYQAKTGMSARDIAAAMAEETWYTAEEALAAGFVDEISPNIRAVAMVDFDPKALGYRRPPAALLERLQGRVAEAVEDPDEPPAVSADDAHAETPDEATTASGDTSATLPPETAILLAHPHNGGQK